MNSFTPGLNFPQRKQKGLIKMFGGIACPFYYTNVVVREGTPMKLHASTPDLMVPCTTDAGGGSSDGTACRGLSLQETYDESAWGQLKGYHFANDTRQRLDGMPIGLLTGAGWAFTNNYTGSVAYGNQACVTASGYLAAATGETASGEKLPVYFEGNVGSSFSQNMNTPAMVRIRYNFPVA